MSKSMTQATAHEQHSIGAALDQLCDDIAAKASADAETSYTAALLQSGPAKCAKKLTEEAVETALAAVSETDERLVSEAADVLYHLMVLLAARKIAPTAVAEALKSRRGTSGHVEKASRG
jgi:phosphoribosyl-ATP pyrophosphohydrolase